jgi:type I restriction enzyme, S subunit
VHLVPVDTYLTFGNGKKRPADEGNGTFNVFGSNGVIGHCDEFNNPAGTIIIGRVGSYCGSVFYSPEQCWVTDNAIKGTTKTGADARYCYYLLLTKDLHALRGGSGQPLINQTSLKSLEVPERSFADQKAIAHILGTLDDKIELNQKMNQTLEEIAKAIFKSWFVDFDPVRAKAEGRSTGLPPEISDLFPDELVDSEIGEIPKGWEVHPLGSVFLIQYGKNLPTKNLIEDGYPVFGGNGVIGFHSKYIYEEVMTLIACRGAASGKVGRSLPKSFVTNNSLVINHRGAELTSQRFIEFTLESGDPENYVTGSAQPQLTIDNIKNFPFITPPSEIVNSFQGIVNPLANRQLLLDSENQVLSELRDTLLPKLISGELRIPDAEKFLEEAGI